MSSKVAPKFNNVPARKLKEREDLQKEVEKFGLHKIKKIPAGQSSYPSDGKSTKKIYIVPSNRKLGIPSPK